MFCVFSVSRNTGKTLLQITDEFTVTPVIHWIDESIIGTLGNFSASIGKAKSKKTFNICAIIAASLINGTVLKYRAALPESKNKILYIDTEQSPYHCKKLPNKLKSWFIY